MIETMAWVSALGGLLLGACASCVPGFPGSAVALLGLVAFAGLTDFRVVTQEALLVGVLIALAGAIAQVASPVIASRAAGGTAGVATGAALGAAAGSLIPLPGASWLAAIAGAIVLGVLGAREGVIRTLRGLIGVTGGCFLAVAVDFVSVLGVGAVLALAVFAERLG